MGRATFISFRLPPRIKWQPTPVLLPGKFHGQRSLVGYSPWDCKEVDTTEQLHYLSYKSSLYKNRNEDLEIILSPLILSTNPQMYFFDLRSLADIVKFLDLRNNSLNFPSFFVPLRCKYST